MIKAACSLFISVDGLACAWYVVDEIETGWVYRTQIEGLVFLKRYMISAAWILERVTGAGSVLLLFHTC